MLAESSPPESKTTHSCLGRASLETLELDLSPSCPSSQRLLFLPPSLPVLRQTLRQKHLEAQQSCRPHNLPVLQAAQQRELEVGVGTGYLGLTPHGYQLAWWWG